MEKISCFIGAANDLDPEYIVGSMTHRREWIYSPRLQMTPFDCDLEATRRYLPR